MKGPYQSGEETPNVVNGPDGPLTYTLGNGLNVFRGYDPLGRLGQVWVCTGAAPASANCSGGSTVYAVVSGQKGSQVNYELDTVLSQQFNNGYTDGFNRLTARTSTSGAPNSYTYTYDRYGNRLTQTPVNSGPSFYPLVSAANNQITSSGYNYDAAGNLTSDPVNTYTYDAEGNVTQVVNARGTSKYVYDAFNNRIHAQTPTTTVDYIFDYAGRRISTWTSPTFASEGRIYWDGQQLGFRAYDGTTYFDHQDVLGTERLRSNYSGGVASTYSTLPWGDNYTAVVNNTWGDQDNGHFAGLEHDVESDTEHAQFRNYASGEGRWLSPDPYLGSYDFTNPQSFNRYSYALNNPLTFVDPSGLDGSNSGGGGGRDCVTAGESAGGDINADIGCVDAIWNLFAGSGFHGTLRPRPGGSAGWDGNFGESLGIPTSIPQGNWGIGLLSGGCEFGACGSSFQNPVMVGGAAAACIEAEPCGVIGGIILGAGLLYQIYTGTHSQPTIEGSSRQEQRLLDFVAKAFCVDRKALGAAIHQEKIGRQKGKKSDLTLDEIKDLARYLPKIPGCTPTAF